MLLTAERIWARVQEFIGRINALEDREKETEGEVKHLKRELELLRREMQHEQHVAEKVQEHHGLKLVEFEGRIKALEKKNHSLATTAGIAKTKLAKIKDDDPEGPKGQKGSKRRH